MRFGFFSEAETKPGESYFHRYREVIDEVIYAEEMGFDFFACSEQHFTFAAGISAPECLFPFLFAKTKTLRFRHAVVLLPHAFNHPLRVAERIATEDILSNGRIELGTGRSNTTLALKAFQIDPDETRDQWKESLDVIRAAFTQEPFSHEGDRLSIPKRYLVPQVVQKPYPPLSVTGTGPDTQEIAVREGLGVMTSAFFFGQEWFDTMSSLYWGHVKAQKKAPEHANYFLSALVYAYCADSDEEAWRDAYDGIHYAARMAFLIFPRLAKFGKSYGYMAKAEEFADRIDDKTWLAEESGTVVVGSPESCIKQIQRYVDSGATEIMLRIDGFGHDRIMRSIEMFGKYVLPHFKDEFTVVPETAVPGGLT